MSLKNHKYMVCLTLLLLCIGRTSFGQTGIGTTNPDPSAALDIASASKGILAPRLTSAQKNAIADPAPGLTVYDTDLKQYTYWDGTTWVLPEVRVIIPPRQYGIVGYPEVEVTGADGNREVLEADDIVKDSGHNLFTRSSNKVVISTPGLYLILSSGLFTKGNNTGINDAKLIARLNGADILETAYHMPMLIGLESAKSAATVVRLEAGDEIELWSEKTTGDITNGPTGRFSNVFLELERLPEE